MTEGRDTIYIINMYDELTTYHWRGVKYSFPRFVPVLVDYTNDPELIRELMNCPQLVIGTTKQVEKYQAEIEAKRAKKEGVQKDSEIENLLDEGDK